MVTRQGEKLQSHVNVPLGVSGVLLRENSHFKYHLLPDRIVGRLEVPQKFIDDRACIGRIAHTVQQVQPFTSDTDIPVSK